MRIYSRYATDGEAELEGVWVGIGEGAALRIARLGNARHERLLESLRRPYRSLLRSGGELPRELQEEIAIEAIAGAILLDWRGLLDEEGREILYSQEMARSLLRDLKDFRALVAQIAMEQETFRRRALEESAKNSAPSSAGRSSGDQRHGG